MFLFISTSLVTYCKLLYSLRQRPKELPYARAALCGAPYKKLDG